MVSKSWKPKVGHNKKFLSAFVDFVIYDIVQQ